MSKDVLECKYLYFVLDMKHFVDGYAINVFSRKRGKKIYKRKVNYIGCITQAMNKEWIFVLDNNQEESTALSYETMALVVIFITQLKNNKVKVNEEKGELELL